MADTSGKRELSETQRQGVDERVARRTRLPKVEPRQKSDDKTPRRPADNSPMQTSRGRASVRRQGKRNKLHADKFKEDVDKIATLDPAKLAAIVEGLSDPVRHSLTLRSLGTDQAKHVDEVIHNVWMPRLIERYAGICKPVLKEELALFDKAAGLYNEMKEWGAHFCWIERVTKPGMIIYKACTDPTPSDVYTERRGMDDRNLILSTDRANIIQIVTESDNV